MIEAVNRRINDHSTRLIEMVKAEMVAAEGLTDQQLDEVVHICEEHATHTDYTVRVAAEIIKVAAEQIQEQRK